MRVEQGHHHAGERRIGSDRQINAAGEQHEHLPHREHDQECRVIEQRLDVVDDEEARKGDGDEGEEQQR